MESENQAFFDSLLQQLDDPAQQSMQAGLGKLLLRFVQRLDYKLNHVTKKLDTAMNRLSVAEEVLLANSSSKQNISLPPKSAQAPRTQAPSKARAAPKAQVASQVQVVSESQVASEDVLVAPQAQAESTRTQDAPTMQAEQTAPTAKVPSVSAQNDKIVHCPDCEGLFAWSDFSEGDYSQGWGCNNGEAGCQHNSKTDGMFRWFCPLCLNDFCGACGEIELEAQGMMESGESRCDKSVQDAAGTAVQKELAQTAKSQTDAALPPDDTGLAQAADTGHTIASLTKSHFMQLDSATAAPLLLVVLVGVPGSGKSTFARTLIGALSSARQWVRISQDELGSRQRCIQAADNAVRQGNHILVDRCNFDAMQRAHWLGLRAPTPAGGSPFSRRLAVLLPVPPHEALQRVLSRGTHEGGVDSQSMTTGKIASIIARMHTDLCLPDLSEGFDEVLRVHAKGSSQASVLERIRSLATGDAAGGEGQPAAGSEAQPGASASGAATAKAAIVGKQSAVLPITSTAEPTIVQDRPNVEAGSRTGLSMMEDEQAPVHAGPTIETEVAQAAEHAGPLVDSPGAQQEEIFEEEEEEEETLVEDSTVEPEAMPQAVLPSTSLGAPTGTGQLAQEATAALDQEEVVEEFVEVEEEEEEEDNVQDEIVDPGEAGVTLEATFDLEAQSRSLEAEIAEVGSALAGLEADDAADSQLIESFSQAFKRKPRTGLVASAARKRPRTST